MLNFIVFINYQKTNEYIKCKMNENDKEIIKMINVFIT